MIGLVRSNVLAGLAAARRRTEMKRRRPPTLTVEPDRPGKPVIYYLAPDLDLPVGGIRVIYRHVDILNQLGFAASVVHSRVGFRSSWFANQTPIVYPDSLRLGRQDVLVVPEWYGPTLGDLPSGVRIVVFNQRAYDTFDFVDLDSTGRGAPYSGVTDLVALLTVSRDNADLLAYAFPDLPVHVARNVIDPSVFAPGPDPAGRRIAYTTTRRERERDQLFHILRSRGVLDGWQVVPIVGCTERQTADIMRGSSIFLSFSDREGFGLPPAEAMACGCHVVGYTGLAGREFFDPAHCTPVPENDLLAYARAVEQLCRAWEEDAEAFAKVGRRASERIRAEYSADGLAADLTSFYRPLVDG